MQGKQVLVTGGAGAIGSRLVRTLLQRGAARVVVADDFSSGYQWLLPSDDRLTVVRLDVAEMGDLATDPQWDIDCCFHLAAFFANQNSVDHPERDLHSNGLGTLSVLRWCEREGVGRLVYASAGCSIAGHEVAGPIHEELPVSLFLDTPYQISKALGEFYCNYFLGRGLPTVRCRFFNSYGPGEVPGQYRNVVPNFIWNALHNLPLTITGTGRETRDFIYVDDLCEGLLLCAGGEAVVGEAYNLGTGVETAIIELAEAIRVLCDSHSPILYKERRAWDKSVHRAADVGKAQRRLGFRPAVDLHWGLRETVAWFQADYDQIEASLRAGR